jgi:[ribosomal protein S5]-alanine N-acetyltransferase
MPKKPEKINLAKLELRGTGIRLTPAKLTDADGLYRYIRDKEITRYTIAIPSPYRRSDMTKFLKLTVKEMKAGSHYLFVIRRFDSPEAMGALGVMVNRHLPYAELGYWLGREFWNQGIMTQAVKAALGFAFDTLKLHRVQVAHLDGNEGSRRVIEKCWFRREGIDREAILRDKKWTNIIRYGLLEPEYRSVLRK